jgi:Tol biopolymer transport system component
MRIAGAALIVLFVCAATAQAQYFGRNKVQYRTFDFQILATDHFDIYYYPEEAEAATKVSRLAERWYARLSRFFGHQLRGRQAVILYAVPAHFQQTNAIEGSIGEGTGGVTEGLRRRIVLPVAGSLADTDHVLGHELVHAYQFDMTGEDPRGGPPERAPGIIDFPLWFVEGMAEYISLGPIDGQTAMWLRDAAMREKLPKIKDLDNPKYFPYRWGHAFWAYIGSKYGDRIVASLVRSAANPRSDLVGLARQLGTDPDTLTADWHRAILESTQLVAARMPSLESGARPVVSAKTGSGRYNVGPQISPDGKRIAYFSERDLFSFDLYVADAATGKIERKLSKSATDAHFDSLEFLNSAGAWSPDGKTFAITAVRSGRPVLAMLDPLSGGVRKEIKLPDLDDALNPSFSSDGRRVVLSGNHGGALDLYVLALDTGKLDRLTQDGFADLEPVFTPDGHAVVFVTERFTTDDTTLTPGALRLARLDLATRSVTPIPAFLRGKHLSPQVSSDGRWVTFIAEPDGVSNLYRIAIDGGPVSQITTFLTGVAGITSTSPALGRSADTGRLVFSVFQDDGQTIYALDEAHAVNLVPPMPSTDGASLPGRANSTGDVERFLSDFSRGLPQSGSSPPSRKYKQTFLLDGIGQPTGSATFSSYGVQVSGGMAASFSDMLGDRLLFAEGQVGNSLAALGGQVIFINRRHRWNWGVGINAIPNIWGYTTLVQDPNTGTRRLDQYVMRQTSVGPTAVVAYPFSSATRVEFAGDLRRVGISRERTVLELDPNGRGRRLERVTEPVAGPFNLAETRVALVHDTTYFGATAPLFGERYRLEWGRSAGTLAYDSFLVDWRRYFMPKKPVTFGVRVLHFGRYGRDDGQENLTPMYLGYAELVHGYGVGSFTAAECEVNMSPGAPCAIFKNLLGSRMLVANFEVRAPLAGLFTGDLRYGRVPIDVAAFFDAGITWGDLSEPLFQTSTHHPVRSAGFSTRYNVFGIFLAELSLARAFDRADRNWQWQFGFRQGF